MSKISRSALIVTSIICVTLLLVAAIGGWVYIQQQNIAQKDRELHQAKEIKEYEQQQINERQERNKGGASVDPCKMYTSC